MPIRSKTQTGNFDGPAPWFGVQRASIQDFTDDSEKFGWAEVYLRVSLNVEGSKYPRDMKINGSFEKDAEGNVVDCTLLRRINYLADALNWDGGVNAKGQWVDGSDEVIADIGGYLTGKFGAVPFEDNDVFNFLVYIYPRQGKDGKIYNEVYPRMMSFSPGNATELERYINYLKTNGFLKEADTTNTVPDPTNSTNGAMNGASASGELTVDSL